MSFTMPGIRTGRGRRDATEAALPSAGIVFDNDSREVIVALRDASDGSVSVTRARHTGEAECLATARGLALAGGSVRTAPLSHKARTLLVTSGEALGEKDDAFITRLVVELYTQEAGESGGDPLAERASDWSRTPDNKIALTEMPRDEVAGVQAWTRAAVTADDAEAELVHVAVETPLRAALRSLLHDSPEFGRVPEGQAVALLLISSYGATVGLWSPARGLFKELEEPFQPVGIDDAALEDETLSAFAAEAAFDERGLDEVRTADVGHALGRLAKLIAPAALAKDQITGVSSLVWMASASVRPFVAGQLGEFARESSLPVVEQPGGLEERIALGLALGAVASAVPSIDLATDLRERRDADAARFDAVREAAASAGRASAVLAVAAPLVVVLAVVLALFVGINLEGWTITRAEAAANAEAQVLRPIAEERKAAEANIKWFETVINQVVEMRSKQGGVVRLLDDLNARYPHGDQTWVVREMTADAAGNVQIKGLTKNEDALYTFYRNLDFSNGLFAGVGLQKGTGGAPAAPGLGGSQAPAGVIEWTVKATYAPLTAGGAKQAQGGEAR